MSTKPPKPAKPTPTPPPVFTNIEAHAAALAAARCRVEKIVALLKEGMARVEEKHLPELRELMATIGTEHEALLELVRTHPQCFVQPKSAAFHGVQVGWRKQPGTLAFEDEAKVISRIERHLPDQLEALAPMGPRKLSRDALASLPVADAKRIGVTVSDDEDKPFVKMPSNEVDKMVTQLIKAHTQAPPQDK